MVLFLTMALFGNFLLAGGTLALAGSAGSVVNQTAFLGALGLALVAAQPWKNPARLLVLPASLVVALGWTWLSVVWSISPADTIRRAALLTTVTFTAFLTVRQVGYERSISTLRVLLAVALVMSLVVCTLIPSVGVQYMSVLTEKNYGGTWRGVFIDKNACGQFCLVTVLFFAFSRFRRRHLVLRGVVILLAVFLLYKTQSKTSLGILAIALSCGVVALYNRSFRVFLVPLAGYAIVGLALSYDRIIAPFRNALHDPDAFTGRGAIWEALARYLHDHWLLGTGYGAFWGVGDRSPIYALSHEDWVRNILTGHNGYLDVWTSIGLPGLVLVVGSTLVIPLLKCFARHIPPKDTALLSSMIVGVAGISLTESVLFNTDFTLNILLMVTVALIAERYRVRTPLLTSRRLEAGKPPASVPTRKRVTG
ncbi:conserved hypothetical protein [Altererythrobacter sp. B11]|nr:conserved hypothetical protein [Altererythrobacter sp. B11]